ncbi:hypothetical protein J6590_033314 [Homalodisca vitripennis]|nr:hypothetical protein J6590_033314 [Homalodisca vitripennis]
MNRGRLRRIGRLSSDLPFFVQPIISDRDRRLSLTSAVPLRPPCRRKGRPHPYILAEGMRHVGLDDDPGAADGEKPPQKGPCVIH